MNDQSRSGIGAVATGSLEPPPRAPLDIDIGQSFRAVLGGLRRQWVVIAAAMALTGAIGLVYVLTATPKYMATASLIIDPRVNNGPETPSGSMLLLSDALVVDSEIEVLKSSALMNRVIDQLKLIDNPIIKPKPSPLAAMAFQTRQWLEATLFDEAPEEESMTPEQIAEAKRQDVLQAFTDALDIERTGSTYRVDISVTSTDAGLSALMANAVVEQYFQLQAESSFDNTRRVSSWLNDRVAMLADRVLESDRAVEDYRRSNNLLNVATDRLPSDVEFASANDQLVAVRGDILKLEASVRELQTIIAQGTFNASLDPGVGTTTLTTLQATYADLVGRERDISTRFGTNHLLAQRAREEIAATGRQILDEFKKIADAQTSRLAILRAQEKDTLARIEASRTTSAADAQKMIRLRALERDAASNRVTYEAMLGKLNDTAQQETFKPAPARVIAKAVPPSDKSAPRSKLVLALALFAGLVVGGGGAFLREQIDHVFRLARSVREELGVPLIGILPTFSWDRRMAKPATGRRGLLGLMPFNNPFPRRARNFRFAVDYPNSLFTETMRAFSFALNLAAKDGGGTVIGITSARKGEGKSTLSGNFATYLSSSSVRVALVDFDVRNPTISRAFTRNETTPTLSDLIEGRRDVSEVVANDSAGGVFVIPNTGDASRFNASSPAFMTALETLIGTLRSNFDVVIFDLPPLSNLVDARIASTAVDHLALAIEWGQTDRATVRNAVYGSYLAHSKLIGAIYTKVNLAAYNRYNTEAPSKYYEYVR